MIGRWSLIVRLGAIIAIGLFVVQLVLVGLIFAERSRDTNTGFRYPLPDQTAAMVELFEEPTDRAALLRALNTTDLSVSLAPGGFETFAAEPVRVPEIERALEAYIAQLGGRRLTAFIALPPGTEARITRRDQSLWTEHPMRMVIELATGEVLIVESRGGDLTAKAFSWPLGFFSGLFAVVVALIVLWAVRRETAPLQALAAAARSFSGDGGGRPVPARGAPELRRLIDAFNGMQKRIGDLLASRTLMLGALGHDLRTYVTRLRLRLDLVADRRLRDAAIADLERMSDLIDDGVMLARIGIEGVGCDVTDLHDVLQEIGQQHGSSNMSLDVPDRPLPVTGSRPTYSRLFKNLIENAIKYGDRCSVRLHQSGGIAIVEIEDDGPGVPTDDIDNIVRPFYRSDIARTLDRPGHGLGLAIANEIAVGAGGSLELLNSDGAGLRCIVRLPVARTTLGGGLSVL